MEIGKILLLTYIIIASNYCSNLLSSGLKNAIENNRFVQHLILLILIMSLILIFDEGNAIKFTSNNQLNLIIMSLLIYTWFILTTKLDLAWNIAIMIILLVYFFYENKKNIDYKNIVSDKNLSTEHKNELYNTLITTQKSLLLGIFGITLTGTIIYGTEKYYQYNQTNNNAEGTFVRGSGGGAFGKNNNSFNLTKFLFL